MTERGYKTHKTRNHTRRVPTEYNTTPLVLPITIDINGDCIIRVRGTKVRIHVLGIGAIP